MVFALPLLAAVMSRSIRSSSPRNRSVSGIFVIRGSASLPFSSAAVPGVLPISSGCFAVNSLRFPWLSASISSTLLL